MNITMVGTGYVGLVTGTCLANTGNTVTCLDIDQGKIDKLNNGISPIYEPGLDEIIKRNVKAKRLMFTTDKKLAYTKAEIIFICVGTPSDDQGRADLKYVLAAASDIGEAIQGMEQYPHPDGHEKIVVIKSTVPVGTNAKAKAAIAGKTSRVFHMASNPEFLKEGAAINDFNKPDRVVIGCESDFAGRTMSDLYEPFVRQGNPIYTMDIPSAEMVKYASNAMLATKISFINEIANLCECYGADVDEVRKGMCADKRIGNQFLFPGLGYGGSCFPKDVLAVVSMGDEAGSPTQLLASVHDVNKRQRQTFIRKIEDYFATVGGLKDKTVGVWGLAFKPGTDDIREAPSLTIIQSLLIQGAKVHAYDPVALEVTQRVFGDRIGYVQSFLEAVTGVDALVICTDWDEFRHPDMDVIRKAMKVPVVFDGRNLYHPEAMAEHGFVYYSVGRKTASPKAR
jgi:UDPglucose 6-dehydrogenase